MSFLLNKRNCDWHLDKHFAEGGDDSLENSLLKEDKIGTVVAVGNKESAGEEAPASLLFLCTVAGDCDNDSGA